MVALLGCGDGRVYVRGVFFRLACGLSSACFAQLLLLRGLRRVTGLWSSSRSDGSERLRCLVNAGPMRRRVGNRESSRRPSTRHSPLQQDPDEPAVVHPRCSSQAVGDVRGRRPHSRLPSRRRTGPGLTRRFLQTHRPARERGPENAHIANGLARGQRAKYTELKRHQAAARQCTARPPTPEQPTVPRETPTHRPAAPPARPTGVCPSSPSTTPRVSALSATRW